MEQPLGEDAGWIRALAGIQPVMDVEVALPPGRYDVFLSHAAADAATIDKLLRELVAVGLKVYVDRFDDALPDRSVVNPKTADQLRDRMRASRILVLAVTSHSAASRWIPWELGFFDGVAGEVYILPLDDKVGSLSPGIEFLGLYRWLNRGSAPAELREAAAEARRVIHRSGELDVTAGQAQHIEAFGPAALRDPSQAWLWQQQMMRAGLELQKAWWVAIQKSWVPRG